jgi:AraC-like DNA-binding protein
MVAARLRTTDLPVEDRFAVWSEMATKAHISTLVESSHRSDFVASIDAHDFGVLKISQLTHPPLHARRTPAIVRHEDPDILLIAHVTAGRLVHYGRRHTVTASAGSFLLVDTSLPGSVINEVTVNDTILQFPTSMLGLNRAQVAALVARPLPTDNGIGGLLAYIINDLIAHGSGYEPVVVAQLNATIVDLLGAAARVAADGPTTTPACLPDSTRLLQIYAFIRHNLADSRLTPGSVALAQGMSLRQLNRLLHEDGSSPAEWIRRQRLIRCRRDLIDPALAGELVTDIGARWGLPDPVTFSRAFKREYGMPPGEYRRRFAKPA